MRIKLEIEPCNKTDFEGHIDLFFQHLFPMHFTSLPFLKEDRVNIYKTTSVSSKNAEYSLKAHFLRILSFLSKNYTRQCYYLEGDTLAF